MSDKRAYSTAEAASYIGRSVPYLRKLKSQGKIPAKKDGRALVFFIDDLDAHLDALPQAEVAA